MIALFGLGLQQQAVEGSAARGSSSPPNNVIQPELVGRAVVGSVVSARPGIWAGVPAPEVVTALSVGGAVRRPPVLLGPEDDGLEVVVTDVASNAAGEAMTSSQRIQVSYPAPQALGAPEAVTLAAGGGLATIDAGALFSGASGGTWSASLSDGAGTTPCDVSDSGEVVVSGPGMVSVSYANSGGTATITFPVDGAPVEAPAYDGSLGLLSVTEGEPVSMAAGAAFSGTGLAFSAAGLPDGVALDPATGTIAGQSADVGSHSVTVVATNAAGSASGTFQLDIAAKQVLPDLPVYDGSLPNLAATAGVPFSLAAGSAFAGEQLSFRANGLAPGLAIDATTGEIAGTPTSAGDFAVTVTAENAGGAASATVTIVVAVPVVPALIGTLENRSYAVGSGTRFYNIAPVTQGTPPITYFMLPKVLKVEIVDNGDGTRGRRALTAGHPAPAAATRWLLDGQPLAGATGASIDAAGLGLRGDLTVEVTASNEHGSDALESAAAAVGQGAADPVHLGTRIGGTNNAASYGLTTPAYAAGDLVVLAIRVGQGNVAGHSNVITLSTAGGANVGPNGEAIAVVQATFDNVTAGDDLAMKVVRYVATDNRPSGAVITAAYSIQEQIVVSASVFGAGTFNASTPISNVATASSATSVANAASSALTATNAGGMVVTAIAGFADNVTGTPSGWTALVAPLDVGALTGYVGRRDALTTAGESVAAANFPLAGDGAAWVSATFIVNPG